VPLRAVPDVEVAAKTSMFQSNALLGKPNWKFWAPKALSVVLLLALLADCASTAFDLAAIHRGDLLPTLRRTPLVAPSSTTDISLVFRSHLFGVAPTAGAVPTQTAEAPVTFKLTGTVASEHDAHQGFAILGTTDGVTRLVSSGASLPGGWRLSLVFPDQVILERLGAQLRVALPHPRNRLARQWQEPVVLAAEESQQQDDSSSPSEDLRHRFWIGELRARPLVYGTQVRGYRLAPPRDLARRLGLHSGDIVTTLNGVVLDGDTTVDKQLQNLGDTVSMTILRQGVSQTVKVRLDDTDIVGASPP
jgi:type II secretion system protein C